MAKAVKASKRHKHKVFRSDQDLIRQLYAKNERHKKWTQRILACDLPPDFFNPRTSTTIQNSTGTGFWTYMDLATGQVVTTDPNLDVFTHKEMITRIYRHQQRDIHRNVYDNRHQLFVRKNANKDPQRFPAVQVESKNSTSSSFNSGIVVEAGPKVMIKLLLALIEMRLSETEAVHPLTGLPQYAIIDVTCIMQNTVLSLNVFHAIANSILAHKNSALVTYDPETFVAAVLNLKPNIVNVCFSDQPQLLKFIDGLRATFLIFLFGNIILSGIQDLVDAMKLVDFIFEFVAPYRTLTPHPDAKVRQELRVIFWKKTKAEAEELLKNNMLMQMAVY
jgi:TATA-box binding protein (TBP) (component of TFIID and TFIIIB)